jgi:hypothetical protein
VSTSELSLEDESLSVVPSESVPSRTLPLFGAFLGAGLAVLLFTLFTVNHRSEKELETNPWSERAHVGISYWNEHGWFQAAGLPVRKTRPPERVHYFYRSSTGAYLLTGLLVQKIYGWFGDGYAWRAVAIHHQVISLITSALLALVAFRVASRFGVRPFHAFALAVVTQVVFFTFPDNLELYWEMTEMQWWMLLALVFLLFEERTIGVEPARRTIVIRALLVFAMALLSVTTTPFFVAAYIAARLIVHGLFPGWKAVAAAMLVPAALAILIYKGQIALVERLHPDMPIYGSTLMFRSGFDGSPKFYTDHADILYGRRPVRAGVEATEDRSLRRPWLFAAGGLSILALLIAFARGRIAAFPVLALAAVGGAYALYAGIFSQAIVIHPYLYDAIVALPLILAIFTGLPALLETLTTGSGAFVLLAVFAGFIHSNANLREYAMRYPQDLAPANSAAGAPKRSGPGAAVAAAAAAAPDTTYGTWKTVPWAKTNFTANAGEWNVDETDQGALSYTYIGPKTMMLSFLIQTTDVTATPLTLQIAIPDAKVAARATGTMCRVNDAGSGLGAGFVSAQANSNYILVQKIDAKPWKKTDRDNTLVFGSITFEIR